MELLFAIFILVATVALFAQASRTRRLDAALTELQGWTSNLGWRVYHLETAPRASASSAYRVSGEHAKEPTTSPATAPSIETAIPDDAPRERREGSHEAASAPTAAPPAQTVETPPSPPLETPVNDAPPSIELGPRIDWERWVGVRGAAALGAAVLVVALLYFLRFSIEAGWLTVTHRVALGSLASLATIAAAQTKLRTSQPHLTSWVTGAGVAGLYASIWSAEHLASVVGPLAAFALAALVTVAAIALALRNASLPIALLGVTGGFVAPLSLSLGAPSSIGVLAYVALLDVAMVVLAMRRGWWSLALVSLVASTLYEGIWMQATSAPPLAEVASLFVLATVFGAFPSFAARTSETEEAPPPLASVTAFGAVIVPAAFGLWIAIRGGVAADPMPLAAIFVVVWSTALTVARRRKEAALPIVAAITTGLVALSWIAAGGAAAHPVWRAEMGLGVALPPLSPRGSSVASPSERPSRSPSERSSWQWARSSRRAIRPLPRSAS